MEKKKMTKLRIEYKGTEENGGVRTILEDPSKYLETLGLREDFINYMGRTA